MTIHVSLPYLILAVVVSLWLIAAKVMRKKQRKAWNNGVCASTGMQWIQFDTDSTGGRMFTDNTGHYLTLDWSTPTASEKHE